MDYKNIYKQMQKLYKRLMVKKNKNKSKNLKQKQQQICQEHAEITICM